nr:radical SAM protein [Alistipes onderdonkii]
MEKGIVFSIEEFAIHDGPGIRTTVFLKGCPLRCAWCHNPEGISPEPQYMDRRDGRTMCGYAICSGELAGKLLRNKAVYAMNRGGVTLTGGEPLLQAAFAAEVLAALQAAGVHTAVETSGYAAPDVFRRVAGHADLVLFDVKHADPVQHRRWTGVDNAPILRNLAWLCTSGRPFVVRIPLIPGGERYAGEHVADLPADQGCPGAGAGRDPALPQDRRGEVRHDRPDVCPRFRYRGGAPCPRRFQRLQS